MNVTDVYTVQILDSEDRVFQPTLMLDAIMLEAEENITDLLPFGFRARIRRWDHADEGDSWETAPTMPNDEQTTNERNPG